MVDVNHFPNSNRPVCSMVFPPRIRPGDDHAKKRCAANTLIYHQHPGAPVIETYHPQPGPYARQRARFAGDAADDELTTRYQLDKIYRMPLNEPQ